MISIALYNLKGGVGKTAASVNFAYMASQDGYKTLLWDLDPQGSTTFYYDVQPKLKGGFKKLIAKHAELSDSIMETNYPLLDIIPADVSAQSLNVLIEGLGDSRKRIKNLIEPLQDEYDFVIIDCPPGLSSLSENIFLAVDIVMMPVIPTTLSVRTYAMVKEYFKEKGLDESKLMCFFSMSDMRKKMHQEVMEELYEDKRFFGNYIPYLSDVEKMGLHQAPLEVTSRSGYASRCYRDLWEEIKEGILD
jgi:cellulose biosynthesis protein BcsQ